MAHLVSRSAFARLAGVSPAAITKACKSSLAGSCIGKRIDLESTEAQTYLQKRGIDPTGHRPKATKKPSKTPKPRPSSTATEDDSPAKPKRKRRPREVDDRSIAIDVDFEEIEAYAHLSLSELVAKFGTVTSFKDWLDARKKISDIREKDLRNDELEGRLISRELVRTHVIGAIEAGNRRLLTDSPKTIARRLYALVNSGASAEEAEKTVREIISSQLKPVAATAARVLRNA